MNIIVVQTREGAQGVRVARLELKRLFVVSQRLIGFGHAIFPDHAEAQRELVPQVVVATGDLDALFEDVGQRRPATHRRIQPVERRRRGVVHRPSRQHALPRRGRPFAITDVLFEQLRRPDLDLEARVRIGDRLEPGLIDLDQVLDHQQLFDDGLHLRANLRDPRRVPKCLSQGRKRELGLTQLFVERRGDLAVDVHTGRRVRRQVDLHTQDLDQRLPLFGATRRLRQDDRDLQRLFREVFGERFFEAVPQERTGRRITRARVEQLPEQRHSAGRVTELLDLQPREFEARLELRLLPSFAVDQLLQDVGELRVALLRATQRGQTRQRLQVVRFELEQPTQSRNRARCVVELLRLDVRQLAHQHRAFDGVIGLRDAPPVDLGQLTERTRVAIQPLERLERFEVARRDLEDLHVLFDRPVVVLQVLVVDVRDAAPHHQRKRAVVHRVDFVEVVTREVFVQSVFLREPFDVGPHPAIARVFVQRAAQGCKGALRFAELRLVRVTDADQQRLALVGTLGRGELRFGARDEVVVCTAGKIDRRQRGRRPRPRRTGLLRDRGEMPHRARMVGLRVERRRKRLDRSEVVIEQIAARHAESRVVLRLVGRVLGHRREALQPVGQRRALRLAIREGHHLLDRFPIGRIHRDPGAVRLDRRVGVIDVRLEDPRDLRPDLLALGLVGVGQPEHTAIDRHLTARVLGALVNPQDSLQDAFVVRIDRQNAVVVHHGGIRPIELLQADLRRTVAESRRDRLVVELGHHVAVQIDELLVRVAEFGQPLEFRPDRFIPRSIAIRPGHRQERHLGQLEGRLVDSRDLDEQGSLVVDVVDRSGARLFCLDDLAMVTLRRPVRFDHHRRGGREFHIRRLCGLDHVVERHRRAFERRLRTFTIRREDLSQRLDRAVVISERCGAQTPQTQAQNRTVLAGACNFD